MAPVLSTGLPLTLAVHRPLATTPSIGATPRPNVVAPKNRMSLLVGNGQSVRRTSPAMQQKTRAVLRELKVAKRLPAAGG